MPALATVCILNFLTLVVRPATAADDKPAEPIRAANESPDQLTPAEIARLIEELDSKKYAVRESATDKLYRAGAVAIPALVQAAMSGDSFEAAMRSITILKKHVQEGDDTTRVAALAALKTISKCEKHTVAQAAQQVLESTRT